MEEEVVEMIEIVTTIGARIVIDAAECAQKEKRRAVVGGGLLDGLPFFVRINRHGGEPLRHPFPQIFLKEGLALDPVGIASQNQSPVAKKGQNEIRHAVVVAQKIPLGMTGLGKIDFVQSAEAQAFAIQFDA